MEFMIAFAYINKETKEISSKIAYDLTKNNKAKNYCL